MIQHAAKGQSTVKLTSVTGDIFVMGRRRVVCEGRIASDGDSGCVGKNSTCSFGETMSNIFGVVRACRPNTYKKAEKKEPCSSTYVQTTCSTWLVGIRGKGSSKLSDIDGHNSPTVASKDM